MNESGSKRGEADWAAPMGKKARLRAFLSRQAAWAQANWKWLSFSAWAGIAIYYLIVRQGSIFWLSLGDTDDNIRYLQVRDWLAGQGWFDLRQYRLNPPEGLDIHWSRVVDLPIAALMTVFRLFMADGMADRWALGVAPLLPLLPLLFALAFITRRLSGNGRGAGFGWALALSGPLFAGMAIGMFMPMRVDHHGWQLALTLTMVAGLVDARPRRGGLVAGLSSALSVAIGMEMMIYLAAAGALVALRWVFGVDDWRRMRAYGVALAGGVGLFFLIFASDANRAFVCDALSPVWVTVLGLAGAAMLALSFLPAGWSPARRLIAGGAAGAVVAAVAWGSWPQCLTGAYQISPELERLWLNNIREAKSLTEQSLASALGIIGLPVIGLAGALLAAVAHRRERDRLWGWTTVGLMILFAGALLFWQIRTGPAAQLLAVPGAAWIAAWLVGALLGRGVGWRGRLGALFGMLAILAGFYAYAWAGHLTPPRKTSDKRMKAVREANGRCRTLPALAALNELKPATIFTLVDLGPRIIATTHHSAIAGPYHRNGAAILDVHHAFDGSAEAFRPIARRHGASYLLICPWFPEGTIYSARSPKGFYNQLMKGEVPDWLVPVTLHNGPTLPYRIWRIDYSRP